MRSTTLKLKDASARAKFDELAGGADIFFANRRFDYLGRYGLTAEEMCAARPGLIHTNAYYCNPPGQPWDNRVGFDVSTGFAMGLDCLEGTDAQPAFPPIFVVQRLCRKLAGGDSARSRRSSAARPKAAATRSLCLCAARHCG